jgi:hypothetical protein
MPRATPPPQRLRWDDLPCLPPTAAGMDIAASAMVGAVPPDRDAEPGRVFASFPPALHALVDGLVPCPREPGRPGSDRARGGPQAPPLLHRHKARTLLNIQLSEGRTAIPGGPGHALLRAIVQGARAPPSSWPRDAIPRASPPQTTGPKLLPAPGAPSSGACARQPRSASIAPRPTLPRAMPRWSGRSRGGSRALRAPSRTVRGRGSSPARSRSSRPAMRRAPLWHAARAWISSP